MLRVGLNLTKNNDKFIKLQNQLIQNLDNPEQFQLINQFSLGRRFKNRVLLLIK